MRHLLDTVSMLGQRRRRWPRIDTVSGRPGERSDWWPPVISSDVGCRLGRGRGRERGREVGLPGE